MNENCKKEHNEAKSRIFAKVDAKPLNVDDRTTEIAKTKDDQEEEDN